MKKLRQISGESLSSYISWCKLSLVYKSDEKFHNNIKFLFKKPVRNTFCFGKLQNLNSEE